MIKLLNSKENQFFIKYLINLQIKNTNYYIFLNIFFTTTWQVSISYFSRPNYRSNLWNCDNIENYLINRVMEYCQCNRFHNQRSWSCEGDSSPSYGRRRSCPYDFFSSSSTGRSSPSNNRSKHISSLFYFLVFSTTYPRPKIDATFVATCTSQKVQVCVSPARARRLKSLYRCITSNSGYGLPTTMISPIWWWLWGL